MSINLEEKRRFPRIALRSPLRCQIRGEKDFTNVISNDIGLGGVSFVDHKFLAPNTCINLEINLLARIINPIGRIVRSNPLPHTDRYQLGVEFLEFDLKQKKLLSDYIDMQLGVTG